MAKSKFSTVVPLINQTQKLIAPIEANSTSASQDYAKGEQFILNGLLSEAITAIAQNSAFVLNGNYKLASAIANQLHNFNKGIYSGTKTFESIISSFGSTYEVILSLPTDVSVYNTINVTKIRPAGQTALEIPSSQFLDVVKNLNQIYIYINATALSPFNNKNCVVTVDFS